MLKTAIVKQLQVIVLIDVTDGEKKNVNFDFLVENEFLRVSVEEHLLAKGISTVIT